MSIGALVAVWMLIAPTELGGPVSYVVTFGSSMEPDLHAGDLVAVRAGSKYRVGDAVAYANKDLGQVVLHRIIRREGDRFVFQGDNNSFVDPYEPTERELIGKMWFQVPGAGTILKRLQAPLPAGVLAGVIGLIAVGGTSARRGKKGGIPPMGGTVPTQQASGSTRTPVAPKTVAAGFGLGVLLFGAAVAFTFTHPDTELAATRARYTHVGEFSYSAPVPPSAVYEDGLTTRDPVFLQVVSEIEVAFDYRFETEAESEVEGTGSIEARLTGPNGWNRSWDVTDAMPISDRAAITGTLDLEELRRAIAEVERITEVDQQAYELELAAPLTIEATVAGAEIEEPFEPTLRFILDEQQLQVQQQADVVAPPAGTPVTSTKAGSLTTAAPVPAQLELLGRAIDIEVARNAALAGLVICFLGLLITGIPWIRALRRDEPSRIRARYGSQLVSARVIDLSRAHSMVEVDSMEALVKLAERFDLPILSDESGDRARYIVEGGAAVYAYTAAENAPVEAPEVVEDDSAGEAVR